MTANRRPASRARGPRDGARRPGRTPRRPPARSAAASRSREGSADRYRAARGRDRTGSSRSSRTPPSRSTPRQQQLGGDGAGERRLAEQRERNHRLPRHRLPPHEPAQSAAAPSADADHDPRRRPIRRSAPAPDPRRGRRRRRRRGRVPGGRDGLRTDGVSASCSRAARAATMPIGTLTQKIQCQDRPAVTAPPISGPERPRGRRCRPRCRPRSPLLGGKGRGQQGEAERDDDRRTRALQGPEGDERRR